MDWVRLSFDHFWLKDVLRFCRAVLGPESVRKGGGLFGRREGVQFERGGSVHFEGEGYCILDLPSGAIQAAACEAVSGSDGFAWLMQRVLPLGARFTRLDVALDVFGTTAGTLLADVRQSCEAGELCGARVWGEVVERSTVLGERGRTVYLGRRGKLGSGRFGRVYDKGLETRTMGAGEWVRFEVEFTGDVAAETGRELFAGGAEAHKMAGIVLGAFDFRESSGGEKHLERRRRVEWFAALIGAVRGVRHVVRRLETDGRGWAEWARRAVLPQLRHLAAVVGSDVASVVGWLGEGAGGGELWRRSLACREIVGWFNEGRAVGC